MSYCLQAFNLLPESMPNIDRELPETERCRKSESGPGMDLEPGPGDREPVRLDLLRRRRQLLRR